jgi:cobaltochelatase CobT
MEDWGGLALFGLFKKKGPASPSTPTEGYRVYTDQFDREVSAAELIREISPVSLPGPHSISELGNVMRAPTPWRAKATQRSIEFQGRYRQGHDLGDRPFFTLLIDHSGSMRGPKGMTAAVAADVVAGILEHEQAPLDILGFTTSSWRGGRSRRMWQARGRPEHPGRLCDLLHIVYSNGAEPSQNRARDLPLLLVPEVLKENIDGEALIWARRRAQAYNPTTWVCILISDGAAVDDSTIIANGGHVSNWYLNDHLKLVVDEINNDSTIRLGCLGLDREPGGSFRSLRLATVLEDAPAQIFDVLEELIWPPPSAISKNKRTGN